MIVLVVAITYPFSVHIQTEAGMCLTRQLRGGEGGIRTLAGMLRDYYTGVHLHPPNRLGNGPLNHLGTSPGKCYVRAIQLKTPRLL